MVRLNLQYIDIERYLYKIVTLAAIQVYRNVNKCINVQLHYKLGSTQLGPIQTTLPATATFARKTHCYITTLRIKNITSNENDT